MTHDELIKILTKQTGLAESICAAFLTETVKAMETSLAAGDKATLQGIGEFWVIKNAGGHHLQFTTDPELKARLLSLKTEALQQVTGSPERKETEVQDRMRGDTDVITKEDFAKGSTRIDHNKTELSSMAEDLLGLNAEDLVRGLGLTKNKSGRTVQQQGQVTFPVSITHQMKEDSQRSFRPVDGAERRAFKSLTLKNFFLNLGSVVRDRVTHEPLIVFDVNAQRSSNGEIYTPRLLRVLEDQTKSDGQEHALTFDEFDFSCEAHEVLMKLDPAFGPRPHAFEIGTFTSNDRRSRAEFFLAQEYEIFRATLD